MGLENSAEEMFILFVFEQDYYSFMTGEQKQFCKYVSMLG